MVDYISVYGFAIRIRQQIKSLTVSNNLFNPLSLSLTPAWVSKWWLGCLSKCGVQLFQAPLFRILFNIAHSWYLMLRTTLCSKSELLCQCSLGSIEGAIGSWDTYPAVLNLTKVLPSERRYNRYMLCYIALSCTGFSPKLTEANGSLFGSPLLLISFDPQSKTSQAQEGNKATSITTANYKQRASKVRFWIGEKALKYSMSYTLCIQSTWRFLPVQLEGCVGGLKLVIPVHRKSVAPS